MLFLGANLIECLRTAAWISNPQPPGVHLSHKDNADCPRANRASRKTDTRSMLSTSRFSVAPRSQISSAGPAVCAGLPRQARDFGEPICCRQRCEQQVRASTDQRRAHRDAGPRGLPRATGVTAPRCPRSWRAGVCAVERGDRLHFVHGLMHCSKIMSSCCFRISSFPLDLNGSTVVIGSAGKDHQVATRDLVLATHQLSDWSDCINDGCPRRVGHEALQRF
jgi:hypothetical protein